MKANLILQHFDGDLRELDLLSIANIQKYAEQINADYELIRGKPFNPSLTGPCQKVHMLDECFDAWDNVLMLDIDMFAPNDMKENVFEVEGIGMRNKVQAELHGRLSKTHSDLASLSAPYWGGAIYKMNKDTRKKLREKIDASWMKTYNKSYYYEDEGIMHTLAYKANLKHDNKMYLDQRWCQCSYLPNPEKSGFIHIRTKVTPTGPKRSKIENYKELVQRGIL